MEGKSRRVKHVVWGWKVLLPHKKQNCKHIFSYNLSDSSIELYYPPKYSNVTKHNKNISCLNHHMRPATHEIEWRKHDVLRKQRIASLISDRRRICEGTTGINENMTWVSAAILCYRSRSWHSGRKSIWENKIKNKTVKHVHCGSHSTIMRRAGQETVQTGQSHRHTVEMILETWKLEQDMFTVFVIRLSLSITVKKTTTLH